MRYIFHFSKRVLSIEYALFPDFFVFPLLTFVLQMRTETFFSRRICSKCSLHSLSFTSIPEIKSSRWNCWVDRDVLKIDKKVKVKSLSRVRLFATLWTVAYQAPLSMEFSRQEYWNGLPFPSPGDLPDPGIKPWSASIADRRFTVWATRKPLKLVKWSEKLLSRVRLFATPWTVAHQGSPSMEFSR